MDEPQMPFACTQPDCGMTFTNEDHLHVHMKKHDMFLKFGSEQKTAFVADQTPTPTRFIRTCEEVGLFQDLQHVNPFDEGFKRAMEAKSGSSFENLLAAVSTDEVLHTPQMVYPMLDQSDSTLYSTTNNHKNITISRSSSDESGAVKEYETTTISKLTNKVTTISRIVGNKDIIDKMNGTDDTSNTRNQENQNKDLVNETSVSYTNNVIKISNVEIRKDGSIVNIESTNSLPVVIAFADSVIKDSSVVTKDVLLNDNSKLTVTDGKMPIISQKSIDFVVDRLAAECQNEIYNERNRIDANIVNNNVYTTPQSVIKSVSNNNIEATKKRKTDPDKDCGDYEVIIKLPNGKKVRMKAVEEVKNNQNEGNDNKSIQDATKHRLKKVLKDKVDKKKDENLNFDSNLNVVHSVMPITGLIPVALVNPISNSILVSKVDNTGKVPIAPVTMAKSYEATQIKCLKRKSYLSKDRIEDPTANSSSSSNSNTDVRQNDTKDKKSNGNSTIYLPNVLETRRNASKRYRERTKEKVLEMERELHILRRKNEVLSAENSRLMSAINKHIDFACNNPEELRAALKDPIT